MATQPSIKEPDNLADAAKLQAAFDAGADLSELEKLIAKIPGFDVLRNEEGTPVQLIEAISYRDAGGKGAYVVPPMLPGDEGAVLIQTPEAQAPQMSDTLLQAIQRGATDVYRRKPSTGLDPETREAVESLGALGRYLYAPALDVGAEALTGVQAGFEGLARGGGQLMEDIGLLGLIENLTSVKQTPKRAAGQLLGFLEAEGLRAPMGYIPGGAAIPQRARPVSPGRMAAALEQAAPVAPPRVPLPTAIERIAAPSAPPPLRPATVRPRPSPEVLPEVSVELPVIPSIKQLTKEGPAALRAYEAEGRTVPSLKLSEKRKIAGFQQDVKKELQAVGVEQPENVTFQDFIASHLSQRSLPSETLASLVEKHQMFGEDDLRRAMGADRATTTQAARVLNLNSQASRLVLQLADMPGMRAKLTLAKPTLNKMNAIGQTLRWIGRTRAGLLTTQMVTAARNAWSAMPIMPTYAMITELTDAGIRQARNLNRGGPGQAPILQGPNMADALYSYFDELSRSAQTALGGATDIVTLGGKPFKGTKRQQRTTAMLEEIKKAFPKARHDLFDRWESDYVRPDTYKDTVFGRLQRKTDTVVDTLNIMNRAVDRWTKNAQFPAILRMEAKRNGVDLDALYDAGKINTLDPKILDDAVRLMQKRVFEEAPSGDIGKAAVTLMEYITQPAGITPFPRFAVSYLKYVAEQNPAAIVRFASPAERAKVAAGDHRAITKMLAGTAMTLAIIASKDPDKGEWYEIALPGREGMVDVRSLAAPLMPAMFTAHVFWKAMKDDLGSIRISDFIQTISPANFRAGVGLSAIDGLFDDMADAGKSQSKADSILSQWAQDYFPGFLVFFNQFKDTSGQFLSDEDLVKRSPETTAQAIANLFPGGAGVYEAIAGEAIPERQLVTRGETPRYVDPLARQLFGITFQEPRNIVEEVTTRVGMRGSDLYRNTGIRDFDNLMRERVGELASKKLVPLLEKKREEFEKISPAEVRVRIKDWYEKARAVARDEIKADDPRLALMLKFDRLSADERQLRNQKAKREKGKTLVEMFRESEGLPLVRSERKLSRLPSGTKYMDLNDYRVKVKP